MSSFGKRVHEDVCRRGDVRRQVRLAGSAVTLGGSKSVIVEDLCPSGAKLFGRRLPATGEEVLLRTSELAVLGRITWANDDFRGIVFDDEERPSAGVCLALSMKARA